MKWKLLLAAALALGGCNDDLGFCQSTTAQVYEPQNLTIDSFPDDSFTVDDPQSSTGLRVRIVAGENFELPVGTGGFKKVFDDLSTLDGFGTTAPMFLRFDHPLDGASVRAGLPGAGRNTPDAAVLLVRLDGPKPELAEVSVELLAEDLIAAGVPDPQTTMIVTPLHPLAPKARYGLAVTRRAKAADGGCVAPSPTLRALLSGAAPTPALERMVPRYAELVSALRTLGAAASPADVSAALVFTTQHTVEDSATIARAIRQRPAPWTSAGKCQSRSNYRVCEGRMAAFDYRDKHLYVDEKRLEPHDAYQVPVTVYLPLAAAPEGGYPTVIFGHGLGGDRHQAERLAELSAPQGLATVAIDAVKHGDHPDLAGRVLGDPQIDVVLSFFGVSFTGSLVDARKLRDNWRQSTYDKLQLVEMLRPGVDVDGDSKRDVSLDKAIYLGVSLGGIMSAEFLAFAPEVRLAVPIVPGARVTQIIEDGAVFAPVIQILGGQSTPGTVARFIPVLQTAIDRGDAGAYTRHVLGARLPGFDAERPQVLVQMVIGDDTVPNSTNHYFARGLGVPLLGDELQPIDGAPRGGPLPLAGNLDAKHTGGVFQFDVILQGTGPATREATHSNVADSSVAIAQSLRFIASWLDKGGAAEIIDPYRTLGVKK